VGSTPSGSTPAATLLRWRRTRRSPGAIHLGPLRGQAFPTQSGVTSPRQSQHSRASVSASPLKALNPPVFQEFRDGSFPCKPFSLSLIIQSWLPIRHRRHVRMSGKTPRPWKPPAFDSPAILPGCGSDFRVERISTVSSDWSVPTDSTRFAKARTVPILESVGTKEPQHL
jgi:hypothetical protein